jgi:hypothetical protein
MPALPLPTAVISLCQLRDRLRLASKPTVQTHVFQGAKTVGELWGSEDYEREGQKTKAFQSVINKYGLPYCTVQEVITTS